MRGLLASEDENIKLKAAKTVLDSLMAINASASKAETAKQPMGVVVVHLPDDGRDPQMTARIREHGRDSTLN